MASVNSIEHAELPLLFEKRLGQPIVSGLVAYCDVHDLIATISDATGDVVVYRINGQTAFVVKGRGNDGRVTVLKWKPDGSLLGLGWTDGLCGVYSGEDGRLLSQSSVIDFQEERDWRLDLAPDFEPASQTIEYVHENLSPQHDAICSLYPAFRWSDLVHELSPRSHLSIRDSC